MQTANAQDEPQLCAPVIDYIKLTLGIEEFDASYNTHRLGEINLEQNESADLGGMDAAFENLSMALEYTDINETCGIPDNHDICAGMNVSLLGHHLIIRDMKPEKIEYMRMLLNPEKGVRNYWEFAGRTFSFYLKDIQILGACDYKEGYYCSDMTARNKCMVIKPKVCNIEVFATGYRIWDPKKMPGLCGCPPFYSVDGNDCMLPECTEGNWKNRKCLFSGDKDGSRVAGTYCLNGKWRYDFAVEDCSAKGETCIYSQNGEPLCSDFKCSDGTAFGECSANKPQYCTPKGRLFEDIERCGCPQTHRADATQTRCIPLSCSDGTLEGNCSKNGQMVCIEGELVNDTGLCGSVEAEEQEGEGGAEIGGGDVENKSAGNITVEPAPAETDNGKEEGALKPENNAGGSDIYVYALGAVAIAAAAGVAYFKFAKRRGGDGILPPSSNVQ